MLLDFQESDSASSHLFLEDEEKMSGSGSSSLASKSNESRLKLLLTSIIQHF